MSHSPLLVTCHRWWLEGVSLAGAECQVVVALLEREGPVLVGESSSRGLCALPRCAQCSAQQPACPAHSAQLSCPAHTHQCRPCPETRATFQETRAICIWPIIRRRMGLTFLPASDNLFQGNYVIMNASQCIAMGGDHTMETLQCARKESMFMFQY